MAPAAGTPAGSPTGSPPDVDPGGSTDLRTTGANTTDQHATGADLTATDPRVLADRFAAQLLTERAALSPVDVVGHLLAVQSQDARGARLAIRARSTGTRADDVDRALTEDRTLAVGWLNRGTLHLVRAEDYWWLHSLTTPQLATHIDRRLAQEGVSPDDAERGVTVVDKALATHGPLVRAALRALLASADVPVAGQAVVHLLGLACLRGTVVRGPVTGVGAAREQAYVLADDWLGPPEEVERGVALGELARRYLTGHGPASEADLARWAGIPLRDARAGLARVKVNQVDLATVDDGRRNLTEVAPHARRAAGDADVLVDVARGPRAAPAAHDHGGTPAPTLLGAFDPVLLGWRSRTGILGEHAASVVSGGVFRAFALVEGRAAGTWRIVSRDARVEFTPFGPLPAAVTTALEAEATDVERFLGLADGRKIRS